MEADWEELGRVMVPPMLPGLPSPAASTVAFDDQQELLWVANDQGRLSSYHGAELQQYSSIIAHIGEGPIRQMLFHEEGVISLASRSIHVSSRKGRNIWHSTHPSMVDLRCMAFTTTRNRLVVAGCQPSLLVIDLMHGEIISEHPAQANYTIMKKARHICAATDNGEVSILNADNLKVLKTWKGHGGAISDLDARGEFLVTCGHSSRPMGQAMMDPLANVYDLKTFNTLPPLPFHAGAAYVCLHPKLQTTSFIASQTGQLQVVDLMNPNSINLRQLNLQYMLGMQLAPAGNALAIIDAEGSVQLWGSRSKIRFSSQRQETEFAHPVSDSTPYVDWRDTPLNTVGMQYYHEPLLSAWPSHWQFDMGAPPPLIDQQLSLAPSEMGYFAPNPKTTYRYQVEDTRSTVMGTTMVAPKFLSEKAKDTPKERERKMSKAAQMLAETTLDSPVAQEGQLAKYSNVEIKYSRFGVDDFDFRYYNKTQFSGLETHIANSFTNALLQLYRFIPLVRNLALHHASTSCKADACLLCEMGFLTDMLEKAAGQNCQATNLLRCFSVLPEATSLGLVEERVLTGGATLSSTIQSINRFMMKQIAQDSKDLTGSSDDVDNITATNTLESIRCMFCYNEITRPSTSYVLDLVYPQNSPAIDPKILLRNPMYKFSSILKASIERESKSRGWCNKCRRYQQLSLRKSVQSLPLTMMVNAALGDLSLHSLWEVPGWLPLEVGILMHANGTFSCFEGKELQFEIRRNTQNSMLVYDLVGFVAEIDIPEHQRPHLVSFINVDVTTNQQSEGNWHLFNDFLVSPVTANEALAFKQEFKVPSVLAYQIQSARGAIDHSWKDNLNTTLLFDEDNINGGAHTPECKLLDISEEPMAGTPIALDTEFVDLEKAEIDVKADGTQETIRPAKSGLARVSVLRGAGESEGTPFIDDYITIPEASIVDHKTQYSGIHPGDLDPQSSSHHLVPLKIAYKRLWLLLNLGCVFVGHGLASDFRKINIQVPKNQTVDTQYLYLEPGKNRRFSLRYLAWAVFKEYIQEETPDATDVAGHDSIEDARMALRLWRKFQNWQAAGVAEQMVDEIYRKGFRYQWKPPVRGGSGSVTGTGVNSTVASGRNTPEVTGTGIGMGMGIGSAPATPARGLRFSAGVPAFAPRAGY